MHLPNYSAVVLAFASVAQSAALQKRELLQDLQQQAIQNLKESGSNSGTCTVENASIRQDWYMFSAPKQGQDC